LTAVAYALLAHYLSSAEAIAVAILPLVLAPPVLAFSARRHPALAALAAAGLFVAAIALHLQFGVQPLNLAWFYLVQDSALNIGLAVLFGRTLREGRVPLCSQLAGALHPEPSPLLLRYTRGITIAWTLFFVAMLLTSFVLFVTVPRAVWSLFANILYWPLLLAMFVIEYGVRICVLPRDQRAGFIATMRAFMAFVRPPRAPAPTTSSIAS
jgi:uncharacterized membrane protein